jgi:hypothetical protein
MTRLIKSLNAWGNPDFINVLKQEIEQLDGGQLPLQQGVIRAKVGIFYSGIITGCSCADDPTPAGEQNEYCEVQVDIDKATAEARIALLA